MKKSDFYPIVAKKAHLTKKAAKEAIDTFLAEIVRALQKGEKVVLSGVGTFEVKMVKEKQVVPFGQFDQRKTIKSHHVVNFKVGKPLKKAVW